MPNRNVIEHALTLALAALSGCAGLVPPARSNGAQFSEDGVHIAVVGQRCSESGDAGRPGQRLLQVTLAIEVGNATPRPLAVRRESMTLVLPGEVAARTSTPEAAQILDVDPGTTAPFELSFVAHGVRCNQELRLEASAAVESRGRPITIGGVRFVPRE